MREDSYTITGAQTEEYTDRQSLSLSYTLTAGAALFGTFLHGIQPENAGTSVRGEI